MRTKTVCVLGGTGFVGHHLVHHLACSGRRVRVLSGHRERHKDLLVLPSVELVETQVHDYSQLARQVAGSDAVINLVGVLHDERGGGRGFREAHVELVLKVIRACQEQGVPRLVHMSALRANAATAPSYYLRSKGEGEERVLDAAKQGLQAVAFRPSTIFGPGDHFVNRFARLLRLSPYVMPLPGARARFAPVYVDDVVKAFEGALEGKQSGRVFELCGPQEYTLRELVELIAREAGMRRRIVGLGDGLSRTAALALEFAPGKPLTMDNYRSMRLDNVCGRDGHSDGMAAFGITPTPLESVLRQLLAARGARSAYRRFRSLARRD